MSKSKSSKRWLQEHFKDVYVKQAQREGYPSRSAYKLLEIQQKDHLIQPGMIVVDLGAAPGGWSMVAKKLVGEQGQVFSLDLLPLETNIDTTFIQGDFTDQMVLNQLLENIGDQSVEVVLSDMAPNLSGVKGIDQPRAIYLCELALDFACQVLKPKGSFLVKVFQGEGSEQYLKTLRQAFAHVVIRKPKSSRSRSNEIYVLAQSKL